MLSLKWKSGKYKYKNNSFCSDTVPLSYRRLVGASDKHPVSVYADSAACVALRKDSIQHAFVLIDSKRRLVIQK